jgi:integration host factor subunit beta
MNRSVLVERFAERHNMPKPKAKLLISLVFKELSEALARGERIEFRGFGSLFLKEYEACTAKNPKSGQLVQLEPRKKVRFRASPMLLEKLSDALL